jgi:multidrug resistance protein
MKDKRRLILFVTVFIDLVGFGIIVPLNPYLAESFGASPLQVGLLMSVYSLMQFLFSPFWGQLSDRIGRRPVILISLLGGGLSHLGFAFASQFWGLVLARAMAGLFGGNISTAMAYMADITDEKDRSKGMGMIGAAFALGFILGPSLGGIFAEVGKNLGTSPPLGQSFPAVIAALICISNCVLAWWWLPESRPAGAPQRNLGGRFERIWRTLHAPTLSTLMILLFLNTLALAHVEASLFLYVQSQFQWTLTQASFGFAYIGLIMVITQGYLIRKLMPKYGERHVLALGFALSVIGFTCSSMASQLWLLAIGVTALGFGNGLATPSLNGSISLMAAKDAQGHSLGVSQSLSSLARILGPASGGYLYQALSPRSPFAFAALVILVGGLLMTQIYSKMPEGGRAH